MGLELPRKLTRYQEHIQNWKGGCGSSICPPNHPTTKVCLARGSIPCDILFIGEAPGESENIFGRPFCGPAGDLLNKIIERSIGEENQRRIANGLSPFTHAISNLVGCIPRPEDEDEEADSKKRKAHEPPDEAIKLCSQRVMELIEICEPKLIVQVGKLAKTWLARGYHHSISVPRHVRMVSIIHPSAILRSQVAVRNLRVQEAIVTLRNAVEDITEDNETVNQ